MRELVIASNNKGKIAEIRAMIQDIQLLSLKDIGFEKEIPEPYNTFEENAATKANTIWEYSGKNAFADDSGICVNALGGTPGVFSARYGGKGATDEANLQKLLSEMQGKKDRTAYYKAVICLVWNGETHYFDGVCNGRLLESPQGQGGFGYDPIFVPDGYDQSFGELHPTVKHSISHRGIAVGKMVAFLQQQIQAK
jgi:XTP/dITP diphosphohydrolase